MSNNTALFTIESLTGEWKPVLGVMPSGFEPISHFLSELTEEQTVEDREMRQVMAALEWDSVDAPCRFLLEQARISNVQEFVDLRCVLFPTSPLRFFVNWIAAYGMGRAQTLQQLETLIAAEYLDTLRDRFVSKHKIGGSRALDADLVSPDWKIRPACAYLELPSGSRFFHSRFEKDTPERRLWVEAIADAVGFSGNLKSDR